MQGPFSNGPYGVTGVTGFRFLASWLDESLQGPFANGPYGLVACARPGADVGDGAGCVGPGACIGDVADLACRGLAIAQ
jgi:hypothetical protein